jgi:flagellar basal-body rod modification protein FlgD
MAAAILGNLSRLSAMVPEEKSATPLKNAASNTAGASASDSGAAAITANDFLTLLVTELKNQDPTANTDPNEYINQLVQVNSLEQLISINQTLLADSQGSPGNYASTGRATIHGGSAAANRAAGSFSIPAPNPSAHRVAQALSSTHSVA